MRCESVECWGDRLRLCAGAASAGTRPGPAGRQHYVSCCNWALQCSSPSHGCLAYDESFWPQHEGSLAGWCTSVLFTWKISYFCTSSPLPPPLSTPQSKYQSISIIIQIQINRQVWLGSLHSTLALQEMKPNGSLHRWSVNAIQRFLMENFSFNIRTRWQVSTSTNIAWLSFPLQTTAYDEIAFVSVPRVHLWDQLQQSLSP